jgi:hypothetical protein
MAEVQAACVICNTRRPRRYCPGVAGHICPVCCGTERENTVDCPLECQYLQEARLREREPDVNPREFPNQDIRVDEQFLQRNEPLLLVVASGLANAAVQGDTKVIDLDTRDALASLVSKYRALQSGLYYETKPGNAIAAKLQEAVQKRIEEVDAFLTRNNSVLRNADVLGVLAFLQRMEIQKNNGRPKSRAFIHFLTEFFPPAEPGGPESEAGRSEDKPSPSGLILP